MNDSINLKVKKYAIYPCRYCTKPKSDLKCNETRLSDESIYMEINIILNTCLIKIRLHATRLFFVLFIRCFKCLNDWGGVGRGLVSRNYILAVCYGQWIRPCHISKIILFLIFLSIQSSLHPKFAGGLTTIWNCAGYN